MLFKLFELSGTVLLLPPEPPPLPTPTADTVRIPANTPNEIKPKDGEEVSVMVLASKTSVCGVIAV